KKILKDSENSTHCYCWMDPLIKNIVVEKDKFRIFDFEQATIWDPAYDIGAFVAPWYIQYLKGNVGYEYIELFFEQYAKSMGKYRINKADIDGILERAMVYTHTTMLHISIGNDQWDMMDSEERSLIAKKATKFFDEKFAVMSG
ncbi:MAG: hypothetical protein JW832_06440, partial [Deltaproteobacteria bacterium]|nr:hypothetical protein [Deltaproteobacteria bacterium]